MRLNWFSPLPPARSGIADYTMQLLPVLTGLVDLVLWTDQESWEPTIEHYAPVVRYDLKDMPWMEVNRAALSVFHIGNNHRFHGPIWQVSQRHPGLMILHDTALQQFFAGLFREQWRDRAGYLAAMERYYGPVGRQDAEDFWFGRVTIEYMAQHYHLTRYAVESALGVLVHSRRSREELRDDTPCPLGYAPLPYPASPLAERHAVGGSGRWGGQAPYRLIVFGHIGENRRLGPLLQALAGFAERDRFRLDVYGELWDAEAVAQQIQGLGLASLVTLHGFVAPEELEAALASAHLAINLRFPTMGEASVSQLQIWDHALPTLVTRVGWYASLPEDAVAFVRPDQEIADIRGHLGAFLADPGLYAKIGAGGRRLLESHHTPHGYVQAILGLVDEAQAFRPKAMAHELARRVGAEMRLWTEPATPDVGRHDWGQIVGLHSSESEDRKPTERLSYQHMETLKFFRQTLAAQMLQLQRQLSTALHSLRRAASAELYTSEPGSTRHPESHREDEAGTPTGRALTAVQAECNGSPPASREGPASTAAPPRALGAHGAVGEGGPRKSYTREDALRYPLSIEAHDTGFRYLFNFMVVAKSLGLKPGDEVLDFGAGSCFVSELLNRFGYATVAFDIDQEVLAIGQERLGLDPRCDRERARFIAGDGMRLPFRDESFDGIICMNALHHMPDYRLTLAEMCRVLKPGGRAVFAEPGEEHSKSPESIVAMEQYGALEKDVVLSEVYRLAREVGFQRMVLKPYVIPDMLELDYEEFDRFGTGGKVSGTYLTPGEVSVFIRGQPLFCLEKAGNRPLTSASAPVEMLRAKIVLKECPNRIGQGQTVKIVAVCENVGKSLWLARRKVCGYVTFGVKLLTSDGRVLEDSRGRQGLAHDVPPGEQVRVVSEVSLAGLEPGSYRLLFDMVNERVCWFQNVGSEVAERRIEIVAHTITAG
jgi:SAM-dependent methyltransferase/glycosyltransferase involved in cell wall biosynthesis